jgi:hypothetical protein
MALRIGVDKTMLWRVRTGRSNPGVEFIAKFLLAFPGMKFEDVFSIESDFIPCEAKGGVSGNPSSLVPAGRG